MKTGFTISNIQVQLEGVKEIAMLAAIAANTTYDELKAREPNVAVVFRREEYDLFIGKIVSLASQTGIMCGASLGLNPAAGAPAFATRAG